MIQAKLADGRVLQFPDGTDPNVIQATVKKVIADTAQPSTPELDEFLKGLPKFQRNPVEQREMGVAAFNPEMAQDVQGGSGLGVGTLEPLMTVGSGAIAEPVAGFAGVAGGLLPGEKGQAKEFVEKTRQALTYIPKTPGGQESLKKIGEVAEPLAKAMTGAEKYLGDKAYDITGSPTIASLATTVPTLATELIGYGIGKGPLKTLGNLKRKAAQGKIAKAIDTAVPDKEQLKSVARSIYKEIDDAGAVIKPAAMDKLAEAVARDALNLGLDPRITKNAYNAVENVLGAAGKATPVTELDNLRKIAKNAIKLDDPAETAISMSIVNNIDDFLDTVGKTAIDAPVGKKGIAKKYKIARDLWGRARKTELIEEAFENASMAKSGFENGLRSEITRLLKNKKTKKIFTESERSALKQVVTGSKTTNLAKLIGRFGYGNNALLMPSIGIGAAATVNPVLAATVPVIGHVSKKLAERLTRSGAEFADQVIRAGKNAEKITQAYLKNTPKAQRTAEELSQLLMRQDIDLSRLPNIQIIQDAAQIAAKNRELLAASIAGTELVKQAGEQ